MKRDSKGFSIFPVVLAVCVLGIVGLVGYNVYSQNQGKTLISSSDTSSQASNTKADELQAPEIKSDQDLASAEKTLDQADITSEGETASLDADLASF